MAWQAVLDIQAVIFWPLRMNEVDEGDRDALNIRFFFFLPVASYFSWNISGRYRYSITLFTYQKNNFTIFRFHV